MKEHSCNSNNASNTAYLSIMSAFFNYKHKALFVVNLTFPIFFLIFLHIWILCVTFRQTAMFKCKRTTKTKNRRSILSSAVDFLKTVLLKDVHKVIGNSDYFMLTSAPSASSLALISSASALETPSLSVFGRCQRSSFASFSPRPVISRTALITLTFGSSCRYEFYVKLIFLLLLQSCLLLLHYNTCCCRYTKLFFTCFY